MKLYKFYKNNCYPCRTISAILRSRIAIPENVEIIEKDAELEENKKFLEEKGITKVPVLMFENGNMLVGMRPEDIIRDFIMENASL